MTLEELIDIFITGGVNSPGDFNESGSMVPPHQDQSAAHGLNFDTEVYLTDILPDEITVDLNQNDTGSFPDSCPAVNTNLCEGAGGSGSRVTRIRYGDLKCHGVADQIIGSSSAETVFHSVMKSFRTPRAGRKNLWKQEHVKKNGNGTTSRKYIKKKYKEIICSPDGNDNDNDNDNDNIKEQ
ncbi:hypothetical protein SASPL_144758 [Salvia splendens]|uniref:Uncharacterized protein n=1 Tax=Salvia splendens TaxID=180675 RepID=A0A8X8WFW0_SALSN|nr:uncharacterized protein LOC121774107 [Salvia splendens]KAG6394177.1 hypothetical protein SASPL_144758 [Salvia splendens]